MTTPAPIRALYVHVPFCRTLCGYCDFYSEVFDPSRAGSIVDALLLELDRARRTRPLAFETIFFGGGTPTVLPVPQLERLLQACAALCAPGGPLEFTVEANPATVNDETALALVRAGVNRVSLGAQSFDPAELRVLERTHRPEQVGETLATCRRHGLTHFSLDLIFGIPGQTMATWLASVRTAIALEPEHFSCYGLLYEPGTRLFEQLQAGQILRVDEDLEADLYEATLDTLAAAGFEQYEISNFARPGARCRHNLTYWHNQPYVGIGPSAAGFVDGVRYKNVANIAEYVAALRAGHSPRIEEERLDDDHRARETAMLALRLTEGLNRHEFAARFNRDALDFFATSIAKNLHAGLLEVSDQNIRLTQRGLLLADTVIADFL